MAEVIAPGNLCTAQTGNGDSTNTILELNQGRPSVIRIISTIGATPTVTVNIVGTIDNVNWYNIPYALVATPNSFVVTALTITTAVTTLYLLQTNQAWTWAKLVLSANTNVTITADYF